MPIDNDSDLRVAETLDRIEQPGQHRQRSAEEEIEI